jgi:hypothetical protein
MFIIAHHSQSWGKSDDVDTSSNNATKRFRSLMMSTTSEIPLDWESLLTFNLSCTVKGVTACCVMRPRILRGTAFVWGVRTQTILKGRGG